LFYLYYRKSQNEKFSLTHVVAPPSLDLSSSFFLADIPPYTSFSQALYDHVPIAILMKEMVTVIS